MHGHNGGTEDPWVLCGHFLYVVSNNGGIQKLSGTYHIQMIDFCAYLCALCLNVFEQKLTEKKNLHPHFILQCLHPSAKQSSLFQLINMIL